jgi:hypothetical protein
MLTHASILKGGHLGMMATFAYKFSMGRFYREVQQLRLINFQKMNMLSAEIIVLKKILDFLQSSLVIQHTPSWQ